MSEVGRIVSRMVFRRTLRALIAGNDHEKILNDAAKQTMVFGQVLTSSLYLWPLQVGVGKEVCFWVIFIGCVIHQLSLVVYIFASDQDIDSLIMSMSSITIGLQVIAKLVFFYFKSEELSSVIKIIWDEFWDADLMGENTVRSIRRDSKILSAIFAMQYVAGLGFLLMYIVIPFTSSLKLLPHNAWYPFDVTSTPAYQIIIVFQIVLTTFIYLHIVCAYDYLFCAACANCFEQFRLLCQLVGYIGAEGSATVLWRFSGGKYSRVSMPMLVGDENQTKLLIICIKHHQKLIRVCNQMNIIFGNGHLIQLFASIMGVCTTCYRLTTETSFNNLAFSLSFCGAHFCQLLMYCGVSNELSHWSTNLSVEAFQAHWYAKKYKDIKKCLSLLIMRAQRPISMNTLGVVELNYATFVSVLRFTFSFYTFLNQMTEE